MKLFLAILILGFGSNSFGQKFEKISETEKQLIGSNSTEMMRVYNRNSPTDSITLKAISHPIKPKNKWTQVLAERMLLSVKNEGGVGIAAPQVGINRRMVWVQRFDKPEKPFELFINPEIIWQSVLMQKGPEGDLSFDERGLVMRHYAIQVRYQNLIGETLTEMMEGFTAVIFQHERDHLDGILLTDRIKEQENMNFEPSSVRSNLYYLKN
ncbi:peptide deformylase [Moheibacter lacus]|uniref:Peptide deformylase-like n=1 Tax=Moheibacter lacus TaxID=2745851 RepID=A0A838ZUB8_9FLAO|nr:peptide deformylase [Moheibacter lacus]MBA5630588.1 peptide deformylase [Moheibacter lacus]